MLKNYTPAQDELIKEYQIMFSREDTSGYWFKCNKDGKPQFESAERKALYEKCLRHPEEFPAEFNKVVDISRQYRNPPQGECECGEVINLSGRYYGADECPNCGRWYNTFGQELDPPKIWQEPFDEI